jgi:ankyrin repeat protein
MTSYADLTIGTRSAKIRDGRRLRQVQILADTGLGAQPPDLTNTRSRKAGPICTSDPLRRRLGLGDDHASWHASLLWYAAGRHPLALLALGASANAASRYLDTPLIQAARSGGPASVMRALIAAGADVNAPNDEGWTPLSSQCRPWSLVAAAAAAPASLRTLLDHPDLDLNMAPRGRGIMAVMGAVVTGRDGMAQVIREEVGRAC